MAHREEEVAVQQRLAWRRRTSRRPEEEVLTCADRVPRYTFHQWHALPSRETDEAEQGKASNVSRTCYSVRHGEEEGTSGGYSRQASRRRCFSLQCCSIVMLSTCSCQLLFGDLSIPQQPLSQWSFGAAQRAFGR